MPKFNEAYRLTLEIEGLIQLSINREGNVPDEVNDLLISKSKHLYELLSSGNESVVSEAKEEEEKEETQCEGMMNLSDESNVSEQESSNHRRSDIAEKSTDILAKDIILKLPFNDRFRFRHSLFNNDADEMLSAVETVLGMGNMTDVEDYLTNDLCLNPDDENFIDFVNLIRPHIQ